MFDEIPSNNQINQRQAIQGHLLLNVAHTIMKANIL